MVEDQRIYSTDQKHELLGQPIAHQAGKRNALVSTTDGDLFVFVFVFIYFGSAKQANTSQTMFSRKRMLFRSSIVCTGATAALRRGGTALTATTAAAPAPGARLAAATAVRWASSLVKDTASPLTQQRRFVESTDGRSSASVVIVDPALASKERDRMAREMLSRNLPRPQAEERTVVTLKGLEYTVPYTLRFVVEGTVGAKDAEAKAGKVLQGAFDMVNQYLNTFNPNSEVSLVNMMPVGEKHVMSEHLRRVMECSVRVYKSSGTCFDPATAPLVERLRSMMKAEDNADTLTLTEQEVERFSLPQSFDINIEEGTIARKHERAKLDLGGVNKGYTVDCVVEGLNAAGLPDVMFEWGGDCRASGVNYTHQPWAIAIARPLTLAEVVQRAKGEKVESSEGPSLLRVMYLNDEAVCTSGDYENVEYCPKYGVRGTIFDWKKKELLEPVESELAQVSVKCYSAMYADALATASLIKRDISKVRYMLEEWRYSRNRVTNYTAYTRENERVARMYEIAKEDGETRENRIAGSLPSRVVIVGGGLAGLSAAIEAAACGAQVIVLEKESKLGGNSAKATSGINGWGTRAQALQDVHDGGKYFERDTYLSGLGGTTDPGLASTLSVKSGDAISWLSSLGIPLTVLSQLGGHSRKRTHRAPDKADGTPVPIGFTIMRALEHHIRTKLANRVTIMENTAVTALLNESKGLPDGGREVKVTGVSYVKANDASASPMKLTADAVILATGGFSNDRMSQSLLREFAPQLSGFPTTNGPWATGDGVKLARRLGATLVDMDKVQLHPTGLIDPKDPANTTKYLGPEALRGSGGVLLNKRGERFINELELRSVVSNAIIGQDDEYPGSNGSKFAFCVLNNAAAKLFGVNALKFYADTLGVFQRVEDVEMLAQLIGCDFQTLYKTLEEYESSCKAKTVCPLTGRFVYPCVVGPQGPFYVAFVTPSIHYTMGGCLISPSAEILHEHHSANILENQSPILGLFGAGEVTGGVHGKNRLGGNSLLECVVFGRIAGDRAATILQKQALALSKDKWTSVVVRESRCGEQFGAGSRVLRFNLPGALQRSGLHLGEFVAIRGEWDGQKLIGYYSPITLPDERGTISILARGNKGTLREWISAMRPGDSVEIKCGGGLRIDHNVEKKQFIFRKQVIRQFALIAGGSGVAPMLQILRAALSHPYVDKTESVRLLYAAEEYEELTYRDTLRRYAKEYPDKFAYEFVLSNPPEGWTGGVGFVDRESMQKTLQQPSNDLLVAICGPPAMQRAVKNELLMMGYNKALVHTIDDDMQST
ncbi:NADH-dependent fumarate reductase-like protein [Trypanosoma rangeli]|uniref:fumarate reductase (NADH) n=1 Tax=Trypanosoma rangeli TaxID=5698 RepID=A0A422NIA0_TRYRA|nr:NADH-dependent fumarate reductase-like protein [Trypanosoma rangeli]RNF05181.1 NADH-dependent fumarate reductase-like protein [Trypanosoma rangeli]|eukprot:RNF05181.1 NADH-dependent fumarate reductase-like protein [Trypanosoma rangeli]